MKGLVKVWIIEINLLNLNYSGVRHAERFIIPSCIVSLTTYRAVLTFYMELKLYEKLADIQSKVLGLGKDKDGHGYKYVTGSKVLEHIKPLMVEHGLLLKQEVISIDNQRQDYTLKSGSVKSEILSKVMMKFTWVDCKTGDKDENLFGANGQNDWDKGVGSAMTYAERYFLLKFFHINTDEDDIDNPERKPSEEAQPLSNEQKLRNAINKKQLADVWNSIPASAEKDALFELKEQLKSKLL